MAKLPTQRGKPLKDDPTIVDSTPPHRLKMEEATSIHQHAAGRPVKGSMMELRGHLEILSIRPEETTATSNRLVGDLQTTLRIIAEQQETSKQHSQIKKKRNDQLTNRKEWVANQRDSQGEKVNTVRLFQDKMREDMAECAREVMKVELSQNLAWASQQEVNRMLAEQKQNTVQAAKDWYARYHRWDQSAPIPTVIPIEQGVTQRRNSTGQHPEWNGVAENDMERNASNSPKKDAQESPTEERTRVEGKRKVEIPHDAYDPWETENPAGKYPGKYAQSQKYITVGGSIIEPPRFDSDNFEEFRRSLWYWRGVNRHFEDSQMIYKLAMAADGSLKVIMTQNLPTTKDAIDSRSLKGVIAKLDDEHSKHAQEKQINKINGVMNFTRRSAEDIRSYWIRYEQVGNLLLLNRIDFLEKLLCARALAALKLSSTNRSLAVSTLEERGEDGSLKALKEATVEIFGFSDDGSEKAIMMAQQEEDWPEDSENEEIEDQSLSDVWVPKRGKTLRNRPGTNASAVNGPWGNFNVRNGFEVDGEFGRSTMGKPSSKGERCVRCGATDHTWHTCPLPFQPQLAFGKSNGAASKSPKGPKNPIPGKQILLTEEIIPTNAAPPRVEESTETADHGPVDGNWGNIEGEESWLGLDYNSSDVYLTCVCQAYAIQTAPESSHQSLEAVLDSGASSSVDGLGWARKWLKCSESPLQPSRKRFKFGPHSAVSSIGCIVIHALIKVTTATGTKAERAIQAKLDIVREPTPCLISTECRPRMGGILDFQSGKLPIPTIGEVQLCLIKANHFCLPRSPSGK